MKSIKNRLQDKKAQEEMVGFAIIMVIVGVIMLIFLGFWLAKPQTDSVESYEVQSFIQAFLQYNTNCEDNLEHLTIQKLISRCKSGGSNCKDGRTVCVALREEAQSILEASWPIKNRPEAAFNLLILIEEEILEIIGIIQGNVTNNFK